MATEASQPANPLRNLKDFQRRTVHHAFRRLYKSARGSNRFLVADEVGLGKTLVARGIIAKAIEHLENEGTVDRIDIVYVCSNAAIAQQNINRIKVTGDEDYAVATRLTLLPLELPNLAKRRINYVSFTPGTTFDLKYAPGMWKERRLLYMILKALRHVDQSGLRNLLQCDVGKKRWRARLRDELPYDKTLAKKFLRSVRRNKELRQELIDVSHVFHRYRASWRVEVRRRRNALIAQLRKELARCCVDALEPDLVILDEFQRFKDLLTSETEAGELAQELMNYQDVRVLLLSATPYKMLTLYEEDEDHYEDFMRTLDFLLAGDRRRLERIRQDLADYRHALYQGSSDGLAVRDRLQRRLKKVMVRTERVPATRERDAMLHEPSVSTSLTAADLHRATALDKVTRAVGGAEALEYWKSAPYLLNFMKGYKFKEDLVGRLEGGEDFTDSIAGMLPHLLSRETLAGYQEIDPGNSRLRALVDRVLSNEEWRALWLSPSLGYVRKASTEWTAPVTKSLVFSTWNVVPDVIAAVCSYIAERERVQLGGPVDYFSLYDARKALMVFRSSDGRPEAMSSLLMLYPSPVLSQAIDPLRIAVDNGGPVDAETLYREALAETQAFVGRLPGIRKTQAGREDQAWYWWGVGRHEARRYGDLSEWLHAPDGWRALMQRDSQGSDGSIFAEHVSYFCDGVSGELEIGAPPDDLAEVLAELALGSPAVCASRALRRVAPGLKPWSPSLLNAAANIAEGFRSLFNSPDVRSMLDGDGLPYWRRVLKYCLEHDLQAVLDEYVHTLRESLGLMNASGEVVVEEIAAVIRGVLSIRTSSLDLDEFRMVNGRIALERETKVRCRYALRFADLKDDSDAVLQRASSVRDAFNSPFRPFILATTSVGQEGLDFHTYCHRVWHWNLPRNPVDMEQREGRVNRYKGHAVRKNVARAVGFEDLRDVWPRRKDPWEGLFSEARRQIDSQAADMSEIKPYWIFEEVEDPSHVERLVPLPPFSSEHARYRALKRSLAVYRLAFGQPRQEDLVTYLAQSEDEATAKLLKAMQLDLSA